MSMPDASSMHVLRPIGGGKRKRRKVKKSLRVPMDLKPRDELTYGDLKITKSLAHIGTKGPVYLRAVDMGKKGLRERRRNGASYRSQGLDSTQQAIKDNLEMSREIGRSITGRDMARKPKGVEQIVAIDPAYPNAHPLPWGGKKDRSAYFVGGEAFLKEPKVVEHELLHAQKSSWRLAQIQVDPAKIGREEARADTLSGTYRLHGTRAHTYQNRRDAKKGNPAKSRAKAERAIESGSAFGSVYHTMRAQTGEKARAFRETQDKISPEPKSYYDRQRRRIVGTRIAVGGGTLVGVGGYQVGQRRDKNGRWT